MTTTFSDFHRSWRSSPLLPPPDSSSAATRSIPPCSSSSISSPWRVFYLVLGAPFIALAQITVYAGAIMVLFLFVIMLLGAAKPKEVEPLKWQRPLAIVLAAGHPC